MHMEINGAPTERKISTWKIIEARRIHWYWYNAHNFCNTIWSRTRVVTPQAHLTTHLSCYIQLIKRHLHIQKTSIRFQPSMTRNLPFTCFTKAQWPIHSGMSASTQSLMSPIPLEWPYNINRFCNIWHKRHIHWILTHAQKSSKNLCAQTMKRDTFPTRY